jgi:hypothetical protein
MSRLIKAFPLAAILLFAGLVPRSALAAPISTNQVTFSYTDTSSCSFNLQVQGSSFNTWFFNGDGTVTFSFHGGGTVSANGNTFRFVFDGHNTYFATGQMYTTGLQEQVTVPGAGLVIVDVGTLHFDANGNLVFAPGQHDFSVGAYPALCPYF